MIEAGNEFGPGTAYGAALIKVGQYEQKLGQTERDFIGSAGICFTQPLRKFLDGEMRTIMKEKGILEMKRLVLILLSVIENKRNNFLCSPVKLRWIQDMSWY